MMRDLEKFLKYCVQNHAETQHDEQYYIQVLELAAGDRTSVRAQLVAPTEEFQGRRPNDMAKQVAYEDLMAWQRKKESGEIKTGARDYLAELIDQYYPTSLAPSL